MALPLSSSCYAPSPVHLRLQWTPTSGYWAPRGTKGGGDAVEAVICCCDKTVLHGRGDLRVTAAGTVTGCSEFYAQEEQRRWITECRNENTNYGKLSRESRHVWQGIDGIVENKNKRQGKTNRTEALKDNTEGEKLNRHDISERRIIFRGEGKEEEGRVKNKNKWEERHIGEKLWKKIQRVRNERERHDTCERRIIFRGERKVGERRVNNKNNWEKKTKTTERKYWKYRLWKIKWRSMIFVKEEFRREWEEKMGQLRIRTKERKDK